MREGLRSHSRRAVDTGRRMIDLNKDPVEEEDVGAVSSVQGENVDPEFDVDVSSNAGGGDGGLGQGGDTNMSLEVQVVLPILDADAGTGVRVEDGTAQRGTQGRKRKSESSAPIKKENVASDADVGGNVATESGPRRRGRKKKGQGTSEAGQEANHLALVVIPQTVGRVLRSRTRMEEANATPKLALPEKETDASEMQALPGKKAIAIEKEASSEEEDHSGMELESPRPTEKGKIPAEKESRLVIVEGAVAPAEKMLKRGRGRPPKKLGVHVIEKQALPEKRDHSGMELESPRPTEEGKAKKESRLVIVEGAVAPAEKKLKRGRGRPPKQLGVHVIEKLALPEKEGHSGMELESPRPTEEGKIPAKKESRLVIVEGKVLPAEKKLKRGRGRPPKQRGVYGIEKWASPEREDHSRMELESVRPTEEGKILAEKESQLVIDEGAVAPAEKKLKRGRGRPPKNLGVDGSAKVIDTDTVSNKAEIDLQKKISMPGAKVMKGQKGVKLHKKGVTAVKLKSQNNIVKKNGGTSLREEKNLLKEQITSILINAGWTVEYRPRNGRDYHDAVYVDAQRRTHWSVTLAYSKLEKKIVEGTADEKEIAAFTPIPKDTLCKLFRVTKEGTKSKKGKNGSGSSKKRTDGPQGEKLSKRKMKGVNGEQEKSSSRKPIARKGGGRRLCGLSARESKVELEGGKLTVISWMIDLGTISPGDKIFYMSHERTNATHEGKISREGICCNCCDQVFSLADFEAHMGSSQGQPLLNIRLESGRSLLQCMSESWSKQEQIHGVGFNFVNVENDPDDDTCNICADGGDLICCDGCPSTFHQSCLQIENFPTGDWHCIYCACKFCGIICNENSKGSSVRDPDDSGYLTCLFCEEKFHVKCMLKKENKNIYIHEFQFCSSGCQKLSKSLQKLLGVKHELENGFSWTILRRQDLSTSFDPLKIECNSKLAIAYSVIDECFKPIIDERSSTNLIQNICYNCGSNVRRLNYSGFCTFILEKSDEVVAAATIRIHGNQLAEMPFIGTRAIYRRKGMCRRLLTAIETVLFSLDVEKLVIPAISELLDTWTRVFGFVPLDETGRQEMKHISLVVFPGMDLLQKPLHKDQAREGDTSAADLSLPLTEHTYEKGSPTYYTSAVTVGYGPCTVNSLVDSITPNNELSHGFGTSEATSNSGTHKGNSKDEVFHGLDTYEANLETSKSGTLEGNHVEHCAYAHDDGKEALQSSQKSAVC